MKLAVHPALFLGGAVVLSSLWLWLRPPAPTAPTALPSVPRSAARSAPAERHSITLAPAVLERYVGTYAGRGGFTVELRIDKGHLLAESPATVPFELLPTSETEFFLKGPDIDVKFRLDSAGTVRGFVADTPYGPIRVDRVR